VSKKKKTATTTTATTTATATVEQQQQQQIAAKEDRVSPTMSNNSQKLPTTERVIKSEYDCYDVNRCFVFNDRPFFTVRLVFPRRAAAPPAPRARYHLYFRQHLRAFLITTAAMIVVRRRRPHLSSYRRPPRVRSPRSRFHG